MDNNVNLDNNLVQYNANSDQLIPNRSKFQQVNKKILNQCLPSEIEELKGKIEKVKASAQSIINEIQTMDIENNKNIKTSVVKTKLINWEKEFLDEDQKFPDEKVEKYNDIVREEKDFSILDVLIGPRYAFAGAKDDIRMRAAMKTASLVGWIFAVAGYFLTLPTLAVMGIGLAFGGPVAWLAKNVLSTNYSKVKTIQEKMGKIVGYADLALELPMFKTESTN